MTNCVQMEMRPSQLEHTHADMFDYKSKQDETIETHSNEFERIREDLDRANQRAFNAERLVEKFREELEQIQGKFKTSSTTNNYSVEMISQDDAERKLREQLELELASKEHELEALRLDRDKLQSTLIKIADLESHLNEKEKVIGQLEYKLQNQADYDDIKRELMTLKSIEASSTNRFHEEQSIGTVPKKPLELPLLEKSRALQSEPTSIKTLSSDPESQTNHQTMGHSRLHCSSPCLHLLNPSCLPVSSLLPSSSASSSSSSPSSPSQIYLKSQPSSLLSNHHDNDEMNKSLNDSSTKFLSPLPLTNLSSKETLQLNGKYPQSIPSSCSTMVTPTASLLSSVTTTITPPSSLIAGHQISSVHCTKLHCPPSSSWSPPLSSSSDVSTIATTSTDNINTVTRTVIKPSKQSSPKPSPSPTILVPSACPPISTTSSNHTLEPLDTTYVATVVRKLLAQHNIGQRIFARYILSLSQGTVSELLSKPKCWSKLTEKGKESYRKMWMWANSEESILTLKSISPRKGMNNRSKDNPYPAISTKHTDPATQQKIVQILADAQKQQMAAGAMNMEVKSSLSPCSSLPTDSSTHANLLSNSFESKTYSSQTPSSSSSNSSVSSAVNSPSNESPLNDHPSFLLPVPPPPLPPSASTSSASSSAAASLSMLSSFVPSLLMRASNGFNSGETTGNLIDCASSSPFNLLCPQPDNYRNWLMLQEIVRNNDLLKQFKPNLPLAMNHYEESDRDNDDEDDDDDEENNENENEHDQDDNEHEQGNSALETHDDDDEQDQRRTDDEDDNDNDDDDQFNNMEEIPLDLSMKIDSTQSDIEQTSSMMNNHKQTSSSGNKTNKTALPPLREQDTLKYRHVNTNELVQTVKDILSRYSISQRHFGEKILGLSQGSVSDILARPKPWELLTQKGREPFLRMRLFLDDPNAIKQLVQSVSTTATTNPSSVLVPTFYSPLPPPSSILSTPSLLNNSTLNGFHPTSLLLRDHSSESQSNLLNNDTSQMSSNENLLIPPSPLSSSNGQTTVSTNKSRSRSKSSKATNDKSASSSNQSRAASAHPLMAPYELPKITLPSTIDTEQLSSQVRELLFAYSIGQRVFGEAVLNLSQGTVSEILSKPRSWHSLSVKGREPYIRMYTWFQDTNNVQKLLAWKRERDALRRSRPPVTTPTNTMATNGPFESDPITSEGNLTNSSNVPPSSRSTSSRARRRSLFTDSQRRVLKQIFNNEPYPSQSTLEQLVSDLSLPMHKITNWFHNARMRAKLHLRSSSSPTLKLSSPPSNFNDNPINDPSDDEDEFVDNNNNPNNDDDDDDDDNDDDYTSLPTIVPLTSSWLNGSNDSNSASSLPGLSIASTNIVSLIDDHKMPPTVSSSSSSFSSSSKKRKSIPQKIITTNNLTKKFNAGSTIIDNDGYNTSSNDEINSINQTTNESNTFVDILS